MMRTKRFGRFFAPTLAACAVSNSDADSSGVAAVGALDKGDTLVVAGRTSGSKLDACSGADEEKINAQAQARRTTLEKRTAAESFRKTFWTHPAGAA
jgi:hypothetical protein